jgi:hypothetical protein
MVNTITVILACMDVISAPVALVLTAVAIAVPLQIVYHPILLIQMNDEGF